MSIPPLRPDPRVASSDPPRPPSRTLPLDPIQRTQNAASGALPPSPSAADKKKPISPQQPQKAKGAPQDRNLWIQNVQKVSSLLSKDKPFRLSIGPHKLTIRLVNLAGSGRYHDSFLV